MGKRAINFVLLILLVIAIVVIFFLYNNSTVLDDSVTGNVVDNISIGNDNENNSNFVDDLAEDPLGNVFKAENFIDNYKLFINVWLGNYFSCLNKCDVYTTREIDETCFNDCKDEAGREEVTFGKELNDKYTKTQIELASQYPYFKDLSRNVNLLLSCLDDCSRDKKCISECVSKFDKDSGEE
ncbi:MAG: hypothetical protein ABIH37_01195 [archaeon]